MPLFKRGKARDPVPAEYGVPHWRPFAPLATPNVQVGAWGDRWLNYVPGLWDNVQRLNGREGNNPNWMDISPSPNYSWQRSQYPSAAAQTQRAGMTFTGPLGPIAALDLQQRISDGQVRQSGLAAINFAAISAGASL